MNPKMLFRKVHYFWIGLEPLPKNGAYFSRPFWIIELNHIVFAFGHLNAIKHFKCSNNHKLKCLLLDIFQTMSMSSLVIFEYALTFLIKP